MIETNQFVLQKEGSLFWHQNTDAPPTPSNQTTKYLLILVEIKSTLSSIISGTKQDRNKLICSAESGVMRQVDTHIYLSTTSSLFGLFTLVIMHIFLWTKIIFWLAKVTTALQKNYLWILLFKIKVILTGRIISQSCHFAFSWWWYGQPNHFSGD